jgi:hypothetical protein
MGQLVRASLNLSQDSLNTLRELASESKVTMAEVVRRAVATERFLRDTSASGGKILIKYKNSDLLRELIIR